MNTYYQIIVSIPNNLPITFKRKYKSYASAMKALLPHLKEVGGAICTIQDGTLVEVNEHYKREGVSHD